MTAILDFKQLLLKSKEEILDQQKRGKKERAIAKQAFYFDSVLKQIEQILGGFEEARESIKLVG